MWWRSWILLAGLPLLAGCWLERLEGSGGVRNDVTSVPVRRDLAEHLKNHVEKLATNIGPRSFVTLGKLDEAADYVSRELARSGAGQVERIPYTLDRRWERSIRARAWSRGCIDEWKSFWPDPSSDSGPGAGFENVELLMPGTPGQGTVVVGAHYDSDACESHGRNPAADDNASGVAVLIELARELASRPRRQTIRLVAFTNEEEPFFHTDGMGSVRYVAALPGVCVTAMLSLETLGYYRTEPDTQGYPPLVQSLLDLPPVGDFVAFIGNPASRPLVKDVLSEFREAVSFPAEGWVAQSWIPGSDWSDHWSFWRTGAQAVMVTDTAPNRNRCYHQPCDVPERLDYERMAVVTEGLASVVEALAGRGDACAEPLWD